MPTLRATVSPAGVAQLHDVLLCLAKFDENVSLETSVDSVGFFNQRERPAAYTLRLSSLNTSRTAHAVLTLDASKFFLKYHYGPDKRSTVTDKASWTCKLQNKTLQNIFRKRLAESRDKDTALERCELELQARPDQTECRLVVRMECRHGVSKTNRLTYESTEVLHASFDHNTAHNYWKISSKALREIVEYFGPKTDQLDWFCKDGKVTFTSYTEKVQNGREILKQPMNTSVALEKKDFDDFNVHEGLHIGIVVKDFRAIVAHAEATRASITARYSRGNRPMQIAYESEGVLSEFTLMTRGSSSDISSTAASTPSRDLSVRPVSQHAQLGGSSSVSAPTQSVQSMAPPLRNPVEPISEVAQPASTATGQPSQNSTRAPSASINPNSLFIPDDNDEQWDEPVYGQEPDIVMWDNASEIPPGTNSTRRIRDSEPTSFQSMPDRRIVDVQEIAPTQRLSQIRGLFD